MAKQLISSSSTKSVYRDGNVAIKEFCEGFPKAEVLNEALCNARGITITDLCRESGVSRSSLSDLKTGRKQSLAAQSLAKIAGYFGVSVDSLLGCESSDEMGFDDFTYALFHETKELTQENKEKLLAMARFFRDQQQKGK